VSNGQADIEQLTLSEWAVLGVIAEGTKHGFAIAELLAPDGELGNIWTVRRSLVYRSLKQLSARGLIVERGSQGGNRGPARTPVACTASGRRALSRWLGTPVEHIRDFRHELLLKLAFLTRRSESPRPLLVAQLDHLTPILDGLGASRRGTTGLDRLVLDWRAENARAAQRFVKRLVGAAGD
jgi:DNA-binding PadR family transcriptional regulator